MRTRSDRLGLGLASVVALGVIVGCGVIGISGCGAPQSATAVEPAPAEETGGVDGRPDDLDDNSAFDARDDIEAAGDAGQWTTGGGHGGLDDRDEDSAFDADDYAEVAGESGEWNTGDEAPVVEGTAPGFAADEYVLPPSSEPPRDPRVPAGDLDPEEPPQRDDVVQQVAEPPVEPVPTEQREGQIRLYWDYHGLTQQNNPPRVAAGHPLLEGAVVQSPWPLIEPRRGEFDFTVLEAEIAWWAEQGKEVIIRSGVLGRGSMGGLTPEWVYEEGVPAVEFHARPKDTEPMRLPRVWDSDLFLLLYEEYVSALAERYDGDPRVAYVWIGAGHLGLTTANASRGARTALPEAGWSVELWEAYLMDVIDVYAQHFVDTPTLLAATPVWLRQYSGEYIVEPMQRVANHAAGAGASLMLKGLDPDAEVYRETPFSEMLDSLADRQLPENFTLFMGDDWPIWSPPERRDRYPHEADRDLDGFRRSLRTALSEWDRLGRRCDLVLTLLHPEITASNPDHDDHVPQVEYLLNEFLDGGLDPLEAADPPQPGGESSRQPAV